MGRVIITIFGESEKGALHRLTAVHSLPELHSKLGAPAAYSPAIQMAVQTLLLDQSLFFFRMAEEGGPIDHYLIGFKLLARLPITALALPGVGENTILAAASHFFPKTALLTTPPDLYDYLMQKGHS